jgi:DNA-binding response OmpR family regulator
VIAEDWLLPGCGEGCTPRRHDPRAHELYGFLLALRTPPPTTIASGPLVVDLEARVAFVSGHPARSLGAGPNRARVRWRLLEVLATHLGRPVSYAEACTHVYGYAGDRPTYHALRQLAFHLKRSLGPAGDLITTVPTIGLRLERRDPTSNGVDSDHVG